MRTLASGIFTLRLFGGLALERADGPIPSGALQKRRLALLALVAVCGKRGSSREQLQAFLWPDGSDERARHALEQLLYLIRRDLGRDVILDDGIALRLNPELVRTDLSNFDDAVSRGDLASAVQGYAGPLLDGVRLGGTSTFERCVKEQRDAWAHRYACALERLAASAEHRGEYAEAVEWWQRRAALDPCSAASTLALMRALAAAGDPARAIRHSRIYQMVVRAELELEPDQAVVALAERLSEQQSCVASASINEPRLTTEQDIAMRQTAITPSTPEVSAEKHVVPPTTDSAVVSPRATPRARRRPRRAVVLGVGALGTAAFLLITVPSARARLRGFDELSAQSATAPGTVAVLPLADLSAAPESSYFGDGLSEELIHALSLVPGLRVVSRTSVFALKGHTGDVREIGSKLGVRSVLEGSVRRAGERVRVNVRLVDAQTGYERWSESYDRKLVDVLAVQREIADAVRNRLSADGASRPATFGAGTASYPAFEHYLRGRFHLSQAGAAPRLRALAELRAAIAADSQYARAYAALAEAYNAIAESSSGKDEQAGLLAQAEEAAQRAIDLDPHLAEAHASLGDFRLNRWDWSGAASEYRRGIAENPSFGTAHERYGILLALRGEFDEAVAAMRRAQELDPLSSRIQGSAAYVLHLAGRYQAAEEVARRLIAIDPERESPHFRLGAVLLLRGQHTEAIRELRTALRLPPTVQNRALPLLGYAYARAGRMKEAMELRPLVERGLADHSVSPYFAAAFLDAVGAEDRAFEVLTDLGTRRESCLRDLAVDPIMAPLHRDPRFFQVLHAVGTDSVPERLSAR
jgi:TolB-like protein/DNA-binding SARP family transcriptional activator